MIQFKDSEGRRRTIRFGKCSKRNAENSSQSWSLSFLRRARAVRRDEKRPRGSSSSISSCSNAWPSVILGCPALGNAAHCPSSKATSPSARTNSSPTRSKTCKWALEHAREFFGEGRALREVTVGDAEDFRLASVGQRLGEIHRHKRTAGSSSTFSAMRREARNHRAKPVPLIVPSSVKGSGKNRKAIITARDDRQSA